LEVSKSSSFFGPGIFSDSSLTDTTRQIGPLGNDTTYYWRVSAKNDGGMSASSEVRSFRTVPFAALTPALVSPGDGATAVSISPSLTWRSSVGAKTYWLQLSRSAAFVANIVSDSTITDTTRQVGPLNNDSTYFWRVAAKDGGGFSPFTAAWSFRTIQTIPAAPTLVSPASGAIGVAIGPRLSWNASPGASSYGLQVSTSTAFTTTVVDQNGITGTSQTISGLSSNTLYYWRVNATNAVGTSAWSTPFAFTTVGAAPASPTLLSPSNDARQLPTNPQLTWNVSAGTVSCQLQIATSGTFSSPTIVVDQSGITATSFTTGLANNTLYYWRMNATNAAGTSAWSAIWHFTVGTVVGIERFDSDIPTQYRLSQNYPNPFNPSTVIEFSLPKSGSVSLRIFNSLGEIVTTLVNEDLPVGNYRIRWDAIHVASGMYFYQITAGDFQETKRLILLK
jgi:hypothetical protein